MYAIIISILIMIGLSLAGINVIIAIISGAILSGLLAGQELDIIIQTFLKGTGDGAIVALTYALLGGFAATIARTGFTQLITDKILSSYHAVDYKTTVTNKGTWYVLFLVFVMSIVSQNLVPVHIAFIPLLIPALLPFLSKEHVDRRIVACIITFGLTATYMLIPFWIWQYLFE